MIAIVPSSSNHPVRLSFGTKLRALRVAAGLSQEKLGELARLDRTYISSAERGRRNVSLEAIVRLADALGISPRDFFDFQPHIGSKTHEGQG